MSNRRYLSVFSSIALAAIAVGAAPASAEERVCTGTLGAITVDNLRVPQNRTCQLDRTRVQGTITVQRGATLVARRIVVIGNVQGENARLVAVLARSRVGGSVQVVQGRAARVVNSTVDGNIQFESNSGPLDILNNTVGADVQAFQNSGGVEISDNVIDGNLQCKANNPPPVGGGNTVQGNKEDQCRRL